MTPGPTLDEIIRSVHADAPSSDPLDELSTALATATALERVADSAIAHFVDQCRRAGKSWTDISGALGVTKQAVHKRFASPVGRLTARAHALAANAPKEARALGHNYVGTEHVLLAIFADPESLAAHVLADAGLTHARVAEALVAITPTGDSTTATPPLTPRAAACLEASASEAVALGHNYVGTEHILLALAASDGLARTILEDADVRYEAIKRSVVEKLSGYRG
jgi:hypothetical protein